MKNSTLRCLAALLLCLAPATGRTDESSKRLKVGVILGLTGSAARHSDGMRKGIEMAAAELRTQGWHLDLKFEDDQTNPSKTASSLQFLLAQGYRLFIGPSWSFQVSAVRPILQQKQAIAVVPAGSSEINGGPGDGVFNLCPPRTQQTPLLKKWLQEKELRRAFVLTPNGDWGEAHRGIFTDAIKQSGGSLAGQEAFDYGIELTALKSLLLRVKQSQADVLMTTGSAADVANILRARNAARLGFTLLASEDISDAFNLGLAAPQEFEREVYSSGLSVSPAYQQRFKALYHEEAIIYSDRGYDALMLLAAAVKESGSEVHAVKSFLKKADFPGVSGRIQFTAQGDVQDGDFRITKVSPSAAQP